MSKPILKVSDLTVHYRTSQGTIQALRDVNFQLSESNALGILGESGCGKTTLAQALLRILPENGEIVNGEILYEDANLVTMPENKLRSIRWSKIAMIFQAAMNAFSPVHRIGDQIAEAIQLHEKVSRNEARERIAQLYELVGISKTLIDRYPHEYSGGMRQRAVIAMALSCNPNIIIADEPTTALDVLVQLNILKELKKIQQKRQMSIIYISHDVGVIAQVSDHVAVMYAGRIVEFGKTDEVFNNPQHPYTKALMDSALSIVGAKKELVPLEGEPPNLIEVTQGCSFQPRCRYAVERCETEEPLERESAANWCLCWRAGIASEVKA